MPRVKKGVNAHKKHKKIIKAAKGYRGRRNNTFSQAKNAVMKAFQHAYVHRRTRKREFRRLWITRINAACRANGMQYSRFIAAMNAKGVQVDRKILADLAVIHPDAFKAVVEAVK